MDLRPNNWRGFGNPNANAVLPAGFTAAGQGGSGNPYTVLELCVDNDVAGGQLCAWVVDDNFIPQLVRWPAPGPGAEPPFYLSYGP